MAAATIAHFANTRKLVLLRSLNKQIARASRSPGVDEVHDLRVIIRRFRRMLSALKPYFPRAESRELGQTLKKIMKCAGDVRDYDVSLHLLEKTAGPDFEPEKISAEFRKHREDAAKALSTSLSSWNSGGLPVLKSAPAHKSPPADAIAGRILPVMAGKLFRLGGKAAHRKASSAAVHRCRIAAKNLRYTLDFFSPLYGNSLDGLTGELKDIQTLLGDIHDCAVVRDMVDPRKLSPDEREFRSALKKRQRKKMEEFIEHYADDFSSPEKLREWKSYLRAPGTA